MRRIVVTGLGCVTPVGNNVADSWNSVKEGKCGIGDITAFDAAEYKVGIAGEVKDLNMSEFGIERKEIRKMARFTQLLLASAVQAVADSGYTRENLCSEKCGILFGNVYGGLEVMEEAFKKYLDPKAGALKVPPLTAPMMITNEGAANLSIYFGLHELSWTLNTEEAASSDAIGAGLDFIRSGKLDMCIACGAETPVGRFPVAAFSKIGSLSGASCRPFDSGRDGTVLGEGASVLILEEYEHAKARGAKIYAELAGYGSSCCSDLSDADEVLAAKKDAFDEALADAGVSVDGIGFYAASANGSVAGDSSELRFLDAVTKNADGKLKVFSTKGLTGSMIGASGAFNALVAVKSLEEGFVPATFGLSEPDFSAEKVDLLKTSVSAASSACVAAASGNGGNSSFLVFKKI